MKELKEQESASEKETEKTAGDITKKGENAELQNTEKNEQLYPAGEENKAPKEGEAPGYREWESGEENPNNREWDGGEENPNNREWESESAAEAESEGDDTSPQVEEIDISAECEELSLMHSQLGGGLLYPEKYLRFRRLGLSPEEAYLATGQENTVKSTPRPASPGSARRMEMHIPDHELKAAREIFTGLSDLEISRLYKRVKATR